MVQKIYKYISNKANTNNWDNLKTKLSSWSISILTYKVLESCHSHSKIRRETNKQTKNTECKISNSSHMNYRIGVTGPTIIVNTRNSSKYTESQFTRRRGYP